MLTLTEKVKEALAVDSQAGSQCGIRVSVVGGSCSGFQYAMKLENAEQPGDHIIHADGFQLFVDEDSLSYLKGTQIDHLETPQGASFKFNNPDFRSTCGCGESFQA
jgi:iron-sulfur cluster assembly accessory protein